VTVQMLRLTTSEVNAAEVESAIATMMAAIAQARPAGLRYAACRFADDPAYLLVLELDDGVENPLPAIAEARAFQQRLPGWALEPAAPVPVTVLGSYGYHS
jgi:hypothetical protein